MGRSHFYPIDDVTYGVWTYLQIRFSSDEADERRGQLGHIVKRLVRKGHDRKRLHDALLLGTRLWEEHAFQRETRTRIRKRNALIDRARKDVDRALASLRRLVPEGFLLLDDDDLFALRHAMLETIELPPSARPRGGRPWEWKQAAEDALRQTGVVAADRREIVAALGFIEDDALSE